jgi:hypothetical protein
MTKYKLKSKTYLFVNLDSVTGKIIHILINPCTFLPLTLSKLSNRYVLLVNLYIVVYQIRSFILAFYEHYITLRSQDGRMLWAKHVGVSFIHELMQQVGQRFTCVS